MKWWLEWRRLGIRAEPDERSEEDAEIREIFIRSSLRVAAAFALLFGFVFCAFWWSGKAVQFGAARAGDRAVPTWRVSGTVRNARTHEGVPWAEVSDDPDGKPPFYRSDADHTGRYKLLTLAEPHRIRIAAPGYRPVIINVGRSWFLWLPRGDENRDIYLEPE